METMFFMENDYNEYTVGDYTFKTQEDDLKHQWLEEIVGEGEILILPEEIYGITIDAMNICSEVKKIWIPAGVKEIAPEAFGCFRDDVTIYCEAEEQPDGWWHRETGITMAGFGADMTFDVLVNSWAGSYVYTCDSDDNIISTNKETAKVVWGASIEDVK